MIKNFMHILMLCAKKIDCSEYFNFPFFYCITKSNYKYYFIQLHYYHLVILITNAVDFVPNPKMLSQTRRFCPKPEYFVPGPEDLPPPPSAATLKIRKRLICEYNFCGVLFSNESLCGVGMGLQGRGEYFCVGGGGRENVLFIIHFRRLQIPLHPPLFLSTPPQIHAKL